MMQTGGGKNKQQKINVNQLKKVVGNPSHNYNYRHCYEPVDRVLKHVQYQLPRGMYEGNQ